MKLEIQKFGGRGANSSGGKYKATKTIGFGTYNKNDIPVYGGKIDYTGDFTYAKLSTLSDNELNRALKVQQEELQKAKSTPVGDKRTRNARMNEIFKTQRVQQYQNGVERIKEELRKRRK